MKTTFLYVCCSLVSFLITTDAREFDLAYWSNIFNPRYSKNDCTNDNCENYIPKKRGDNEGFDQFQQTSNYYRLPNGPSQWSCPCESHYEILDLGINNYPRYLSTANCVVKPCHNKFNQCKLIHYKVYVLRHRDINDNNDTNEEQFIEQPILPEPFRVKWHLKPIITTVACVSSTEGRTK